MTPQRIFGLALLVIGIALLVIGVNSSHSMADQVSNMFTGRFTDRTTWYILGGSVAGLVGLIMLVLGLRSRRA